MGRKGNKFSPKNFFKLKSIFGFTLSEVVIVLAIFALFILVVIFALHPNLQLGRSRDKRRIADLKKISIALEDYAGDHDCYPDKIYTSNDVCQATTEFGYYLKNIPCDPKTHKPYKYFRLEECKQFAIFATLEFEGEEDYGYGNYFLASGNVRGIPTIIPHSSPAPSSGPGETERYFGCFSGECHMLSGPEQCSPNYERRDPCVGEECCTFSNVYFCDFNECR
ncbi:MAG: type II secretion system protein [Patescibacteria group bacterium]|jgi:type II secretory pathway pseudopilin PulG